MMTRDEYVELDGFLRLKRHDNEILVPRVLIEDWKTGDLMVLIDCIGELMGLEEVDQFQQIGYKINRRNVRVKVRFELDVEKD